MKELLDQSKENEITKAGTPESGLAPAKQFNTEKQFF